MARTKSPAGSKAGKKNSTPSDSALSVPGSETALSGSAPAETPKVDSRKLEVVRADSRTNLFPINLEDEIRRRAYELSEQRGFEPGHEREDWLMAESEVLTRYQQTA